ncbi:MAG: VPLPA-CTERM sorting domain-containing protein [Gammaproteobacteria bacterium]
MKAIISLLFLVLAGGPAAAAGIYVASGQATFYTSITPDGLPLTGGPLPFAGTCTVTGGGSVSCTGISFSHRGAPGPVVDYSGGSWTTTVGDSAITHSETCVEYASTGCSSSVFGLTGLWTTGLQNGGAASGTCNASNFFATGLCDQVSVTEAAGILTIVEQSGFIPSFPGSSAGYVFTFSQTTVPVPATGMLLATALGAVGVVRRRSGRVTHA